jgi:hypothetical protein
MADVSAASALIEAFQKADPVYIEQLEHHFSLFLTHLFASVKLPLEREIVGDVMRRHDRLGRAQSAAPVAE